MGEPLAGCMDIFKYGLNCKTFIDSVALRLALFVGRANSEIIVNEIEIESENCAINPYEYSVNEILYEFRRNKSTYDYSFEQVVLINWTKKVSKEHGDDAGIEFYSRVKANREARRACYT